MKLTRRQAIAIGAGAVAAGSQALAQSSLPEPILSGPFTGSRDSLSNYQVPRWFQDAKFGMWAHWGPQSAVEDGDWYARNMYIQGSAQNKYHVATYGHPSKFGFKDTIPNWKAADFHPRDLIQRYKKAGARYFVSMGVHHDNFDLWNSKYQSWNSVKMGPKLDIVSMWRDAARENGLRFGVSEHLWISYKWFSVSHWADNTGDMAGIPYDGAKPELASLYHDIDLRGVPPQPKLDWNDADIPEAWKRRWYLRIKDLVDQHEPDILYTDGALPFENYGLNLTANLYNVSARRNHGKVEAVYYSKRREDCAVGTCVLDVERGVVDKIWPTAWQTDTCIGDWHYKRGAKYKTTKTVVDMLVDIVSRNGNLLLNVPLPNSGMPDPEELAVVDGITKWMGVNSEAIYDTRPWKLYGTGPSTEPVKGDAMFNESKRRAMTAEDARFTTKGRDLYAIVMGWPQAKTVISALTPDQAGKIDNVELLGYGGKLDWSQEQSGLSVSVPAEAPSEHAVVFRCKLA